MARRYGMTPKPGDPNTDVIPVAKPEHPPKPDDGALDAPVEEPAEHPCPHCSAEMVAHDAPEGSPKHAAWHCDACGGCWVHRGSAWYLREGHGVPDGWEGGTL